MARRADDIALLEPVRRLRTALAMAEYSSTHHLDAETAWEQAQGGIDGSD